MSLWGFVLAAVPMAHLVWPSEAPMPPAILDGKRAPVSRLELSRLVNATPTVVVIPVRRSQVLFGIKLSVRNPGKDWLWRVRVDVQAFDKDGYGRPMSSSFLFKALEPGKSAELQSERMFLRVPTAAMGRLRYEAKAKVVGGERVVLKP